MLEWLVAMILSIAAQPSMAVTGDTPPTQRCPGGQDAPNNPWLGAPTVEGSRLDRSTGLASLRTAAGSGPIVVSGGRFGGIDLRGVELRDICFVDTDFAASDWRGAQGAGLVFEGVDFTGARLAGTRLPNAVFRNVKLDDVDATGASLSGARILGSTFLSFERLRLDRADLTGLRFECGIVSGESCILETEMSMRGANLTDAVLDEFWFLPDWSGARMDRTRVRPSQLPALAAAHVTGPLLVRGGGVTVAISPAEHARLLPHLRRVEEAPAPSFDCRRAESAAERAICAADGGGLRAIDVELARLYRLSLARDPAVAAEQAAWLRERDRCAPDCLGLSYERRRGELIARLGPPDWAEPGALVLFVTPQIWVDDGFRADPLFARLLPALVRSAFSRVAIRVNPDASIDAWGDAIGGNAHLCDLGGRSLRFDPATGWYSGPFSAQPDDPAAWGRRPMPVVRLTENRAEVYRNGHYWPDDPDDPRPSDYASCGARAGFSMMVRAPVPAAEVERLFPVVGED